MATKKNKKTNLPAKVNKKTKSNAPVKYAGGINPYKKAAEEEGINSSFNYLHFNGKSGRYLAGKDKEEIERGTQMAVLMSEYKRGWICWKDKKKVDEVMVRVESMKPLPREEELTDHGPYRQTKMGAEGWQRQASLQIKSLEDGKEYVFNISSKSGLRAFGNLASAYGDEFMTKLDENGDSLVPIISLDFTEWSFDDDEGNTITNCSPKLDIVEWMSMDELKALSGVDESLEEESEEEDDDDDADEWEDEEESDDDDDDDDDDDLEEEEEEEEEEIVEVKTKKAPKKKSSKKKTSKRF